MDGWMDGWTDGRMDGWIDAWVGWRRPNQMPGRMDALQTMVSVNFRRFAGDFHSVAKQASFGIAFWLKNGSQIEAESGSKPCFADVLFEHAFWKVKTSISGGPLT